MAVVLSARPCGVAFCQEASKGKGGSVKLPAALNDVVVGGGGRYVIAHLKSVRKLAVFDCTQRKVVKYIALGSDNAVYGAGADHIVVVLTDKNIVQRWSLSTFERELTQTISLGKKVTSVTFGSASHGPVLIGGGNFYGNDAKFLDLKTLKESKIKITGRTRVGLGGDARIRVSADGRVFAAWRVGTSPSGLFSMLINGNETKQFYQHESVGYIVPSPDGRILYTARGMFTAETNRVSGKAPPGYSIPAVSGNLYLSIPARGRSNRDEDPGPLSVHLQGDSRPLVTLADVPNLSQGGDQWSRQSITLDKRVIFNPDAGLILTIPTSQDRFDWYEFDMDKALAASGVDYLFVTSRPKNRAESGKQFQYQIAVKSKNGSVKYRLDAAPEGMKISPKGLLSWQVPSRRPSSEEIVIVAIGDASGQEELHTFRLSVASGAAKGVASNRPSVKPTRPFARPSVIPQGSKQKPGKIKPLGLKAPTDFKLAAAITHIEIGGGGRYLIMSMPSLRKLAVFDVNEAKVVKYLPTDDDHVLYAAGESKLVIVSANKKIISRWDLASLTREVTVPLDVSGTAKFVTMGSNSEGPLLIGSGTDRSTAWEFYDIEKMRRLPQVQNGALRSLRGRYFARLSPDGTKVRQFSGYADVTVGRIVKSADGKYSIATDAISPEPRPKKPTIRSVHGDFLMEIDSDMQAPGAVKTTIGLRLLGDDRRLLTISDLPAIMQGVFNRGNEVIHFNERILLIPDAELLVVIPYTNDSLHLRPFNLVEALKASGVDYLLFTSRPPASVERGKTFSYRPAVLSKRGGVKLRLESGPDGMKLSSTGELTWAVPKTTAEEEVNIILLTSDESGQEVFQTANLKLTGGVPKVAVAPLRPKRADTPTAPPRPGTRRKPTLHTWDDVSGKFSIQAQFIALEDNNTVKLRTTDGRTMSVRLQQLAGDDIIYAVRLHLKNQD